MPEAAMDAQQDSKKAEKERRKAEKKQKKEEKKKARQDSEMEQDNCRVCYDCDYSNLAGNSCFINKDGCRGLRLYGAISAVKRCAVCQ